MFSGRYDLYRALQMTQLLVQYFTNVKYAPPHAASSIITIKLKRIYFTIRCSYLLLVSLQFYLRVICLDSIQFQRHFVVLF